MERFVGAAQDGLLSFCKAERGEDAVTLPDPVAMACVLWDGYLQASVICHASVMTEETETYGQVILYKKGYGYDRPVSFEHYNVAVASKTRADMFKPWFMQTMKNAKTAKG